MSNPHQFPPGKIPSPDGYRRIQRGQAMVLIALAFIGLAAFVGLTVDAGILFIQIGHLRRAVDSASLAAANQFREGRGTDEIEAAAEEFINLNSLNPADAVIFICDLDDPTPGNTNVIHDYSLCPPDVDPADGELDWSPRKFVRVEATMPVGFAFLPIIGWGEIEINAEAISETASVDIVLVIDTSQSMAYDADCGDWDAGDNPDDDDDAWAEEYLGDGSPDGEDDCEGTGHDPIQEESYPDDWFRDPDNCNDPDPAPGIQGQCQPFEGVREAALELVGRLFFPFDRISIITFDQNAVVRLSFSNETDKVVMLNSAVTTIGNLTVFKLVGDCGWNDTHNPTNCTNTNIADGLKLAAVELHDWLRQEAVPIVILLSDGAANAATDELNNRICPGGPADAPTWIEPFCHDPDFEIGLGEFGKDAEDWAIDRALFVGCPEPNTFDTDPSATSCDEAGQGAVIFTIGLGMELIDDTKCAAFYAGACEPNQGEELLRYIAGIGDDGDPSSPNECDSAGIGESCGNYYFSPTGAGLITVFEAIASRIFTRIVH